MGNERENWIFERICKFFERICKLWSHDYWLPLQQNKNYAGQNENCAMLQRGFGRQEEAMRSCNEALQDRKEQCLAKTETVEVRKRNGIVIKR